MIVVKKNFRMDEKKAKAQKSIIAGLKKSADLVKKGQQQYPRQGELSYQWTFNLQTSWIASVGRTKAVVSSDAVDKNGDHYSNKVQGPGQESAFARRWPNTTFTASERYTDIISKLFKDLGD